MKSNTKKILLAAAIVIIVCCTFVANTMLNGVLKNSRGKDIKGSRDYITAEYPDLKNWLDSVEARGYMRDTFIINQKGKRLTAKYLPAAKPTSKTAIVVHGYTDNAYRIMQIGHMYAHKLGYNILVPNHQFHADSQGEAIQMGWHDRLDVMQWMHVANDIFAGNTQMIIHGISMGAATAMMISGEKQEPYVKAFVADCGYTSVWQQFNKEMIENPSLRSILMQPMLYYAELICQIKYGWNFHQASSLKQVKKSTLPIFFIHGDKDDYVPTWMVHPLFEAKQQGDRELWLVPNAEHAVAYKENPEEYTQRVEQFAQRYITAD